MQVRFFCPTSDVSHLGFGPTYLDMLLQMGATVRVISTRMFAGDAPYWAQRRHLFLTPITIPNPVNVVVGEPSDWKRLWTVGLRNVLIAPHAPPPADEVCGDITVRATRLDEHGRKIVETHYTESSFARTAAARYQVVITPTTDHADLWRRALEAVDGASHDVRVIPADPAHAQDLFDALG